MITPLKYAICALNRRSIIIASLLCIFSLSVKSDNNIDDLQKAYGKEISISGFEENKGQYTTPDGKAIDEILFQSSTKGIYVYVTTRGLSYFFINTDKKNKDDIYEEEFKPRPQVVKWNRVDLNLDGSSIRRENIIKEKSSAHTINYFLPSAPDGLLNIHTYEKITIKEIYPGIDWVLYGTGDKIKYDFIVHAGADPNQIKIKYEGAEKITKAKDELSIVISTPLGQLKEGNLYCYQGSEKINSTYKFSNDVFSFQMGEYNSSADLIIDPPLDLVWSTYYGGDRTDMPYAMAIDNNEDIFITGYTASTNLNVFNSNPGAYLQSGTTVLSGNMFIAKFSNTGVLLWATYYIGSNDERGFAITTDPQGNVFVTGRTDSPDFPLQNLAGAYNQVAIGGPAGGDAFVVKFTTSGVRQWATFYGGDKQDRGYGICSDASGNIYLAGDADRNLPLRDPGNGAYYQSASRNTCSPANRLNTFIVKFNTSCYNVWSTYFGGDCWDLGCDIKADGAGDFYVVGSARSKNNFPLVNLSGAYFQNTNAGSASFTNADIFIAKFNSACQLVWSTYYGGDNTEEAKAIDIDAAGNLYIAGRSGSSNFPLYNITGGYSQSTCGGLSDMVILKFSSAGVPLWTTYYGGTEYDEAEDIKVEHCGNIYVLGWAGSENFHTMGTPGVGFNDNSFNGGSLAARPEGDLALLSFTNNGVLTWSTFYGGPNDDWGYEIEVDSKANLFVVGSLSSSGGTLVDPGNGAYFDNTNNALSGTVSSDGLVMKFSPIPLQATISTTDIVCSGKATGTATVSIISGYAPYNYQWSNSIIQTTSIVNGLAVGNYSVVIADAYCSFDTLNFSINQLSGIITSITSTSVVCYGQNVGTASVNATGGTPQYNYAWSTTPPQVGSVATGLGVGSYSLIVTDQNNCTHIDTINIIGPPQLNVTLSASASIVCPGQNVVINSTVTGGTTGYNYLWNTGNATSTINEQPTALSVYSIQVIDTNGCTASALTTVSVFPLPVINFSSDTTAGCGPLCINFTNNTPNTQSVVWQLPDGTGTRSSASGNNINHCYAIPGNYNVSLIVTDINGCVDTLSQNNYITVYPNPVAAFIASPMETSLLNSTVNFTDQSTGAHSWIWDFGNSSTSSMQNPVYTFGEVGSHEVYLTVINEFGCIDTATLMIKINPDFAIYIPNTFTPNGDNINDIFLPMGVGVDADKYELLIYDRWGNIIFKTNNVNVGWDGKANGGNMTAQQDTYVWKLNFYDELGEVHRHIGHVNLLR